MAFSPELLASIAALDEYSFKEIANTGAIKKAPFKNIYCAKGQVEVFKNALFTLIIMAARNALDANQGNVAEVKLTMTLGTQKGPNMTTIIPNISLGGLETGDTDLEALVAFIVATGLPCE